MGQLKKEIDTVAASELTVLILGETGVGKELVAQRLHARSARAEQPLVQINCAALPETLADSELFGHKRGAFTGAVADRVGKFELADGGTLFLDEVGELPLAVQAKLLRVDVRVLAATNRDLRQEVAHGRFRADLYHRLSVYPLQMPALRERGRDVLALAGGFLEENQRRLGARNLRLAPAASTALLAHDWPGNVRELEHLVSRAALRALSEQGRHGRAAGRWIAIEPQHLALDGAAAGAEMPAAVARPSVAMPAGLPAHLSGRLIPAAQIHCEVSGDVARTLGQPPQIERALRRIFEKLDGSGQPNALAGAEVPVEVLLAQVVSDLEIQSRVHDLEHALAGLAARAGRHYPAAWLPVLRQHAADWLHTLESEPTCIDVPALLPLPSAPLELIADVIDLKLPWLTGYSRRVAEAARAAALRLDLSEAQAQRIYRAALIHGMGRAAVPNEIWNRPGPRSEAALERLRLVPYWTARAARRIGSLSEEADIASQVDERLDGSGFFRGASGDAIGIEGRVLAAAVQWLLWQTKRPGQPGLDAAEASQRLRDEAQRGRFDARVVAALTGAPAPSPAPADPAGPLSAREIEVLRRISHGESNKEAARALGISPSTVRAHLENIFRKLDCTTRAAATLKALTMGLL